MLGAWKAMAMQFLSLSRQAILNRSGNGALLGTLLFVVSMDGDGAGGTVKVSRDS